MPSYAEYRQTVEKIHKGLIRETVKKIGYKLFETERGVPLLQVMPGDNEQYEFSTHKFSATIDTRKREMYNVEYNGRLLSVNHITADPTCLRNMAEDAHDAWYDAFGEKEYHPDHPGKPPFSIEGFEHTIDSLVSQWEIMCADPQVPDLVAAIKDSNYRLAMRFLGADNPSMVLDPTAGHELYNLFSSGEIHVVFEDDELALLKPEYNLDGEDALQRQQWNLERANSDLLILGENMERWAERQFGPNFRNRDDLNVEFSNNAFESELIRGEWPQEAFVVGRDDTPVGLFAHSIDGTRLDPTQNVSKAYIKDVMGFDWSYEQYPMDKLRLDIGERVRLQGDLAVRRTDGNGVSEAGRCPIPIDNHYLAIDHGILSPGEDKSQEPIRVQVPDGAYINIAHDEHENVAVSLEKGEYEFYLLTRGIQTAEDRPDWNEPQNGFMEEQTPSMSL